LATASNVSHAVRFLRFVERFVKVFATGASHDPARLDLLAGLRLAWSLAVVKLSGAKRPPVRVKIPGTSRSVYLRPGTTDAHVFDQIFLTRQYDLPLYSHFDQVVHPSDRMLIIDCGAYTGLSTIWFAECFPNATIVAVEPDADNHALLVENTRHLANVRPIRAAIWDKDCKLAIANPGPDVAKWCIRMAESDEEGANGIEATTIPALMDRAGAHDRVIIKIDIEGGESALFRSNTDWLASTTVLIIELHDWLYPWRDTSANFLRALVRHKFEVVLSGENLVCFQDRVRAAREAAA
jgi:FkbM family methyltransferase